MNKNPGTPNPISAGGWWEVRFFSFSCVVDVFLSSCEAYIGNIYLVVFINSLNRLSKCTLKVFWSVDCGI